MERDNTKYLFNNAQLGKSRLVLAVIKQYIVDYSPSYEQLKSEFPDNLQGSTGTLIDEAGFQEKLLKSNDVSNRYYVKDKLTLSSGEFIYISNQWGIGNIDNFVRQAKELGYDIETTSDNSNPIF